MAFVLLAGAVLLARGSSVDWQAALQRVAHGWNGCVRHLAVGSIFKPWVRRRLTARASGLELGAWVVYLSA
jgi:hypothetical protein